jgi:hypothetical protein
MELDKSAVGNAPFFGPEKRLIACMYGRLTGKAVGERGSKPFFGVEKAQWNACARKKK